MSGIERGLFLRELPLPQDEVVQLRRFSGTARKQRGLIGPKAVASQRIESVVSGAPAPSKSYHATIRQWFYVPWSRSSLPFSLMKRDAWIQSVIGVLILACCVATLTVNRAHGGDAVWVGGVFIVASTATIVPMTLQARRTTTFNFAWLLVAMTVAFNTLALLTVTIHVPSSWQEPVSAVGDVSFLLSGLSLLVGAVLLTQVRLGPVSASARLDGAAAGMALASIVALLWFKVPIHLSGDTRQVIVGMVYPVVDILLIGTVVAAFASNGYHPSWQTKLLLVGLSLWVASDVYNFSHITRFEHAGPMINNIEWLSALWLIGLSASVRDRHRRMERMPSQHSSIATSLVPVCSGILSVFVVAVSWRNDDVSPVVPLLAFAALMMVITRMWATLREENYLIAASKLDARTDALTGLPNRRSILERLESELEIEHWRPTGVILIDLDGFKEVNDTLGHLAGDELLCMVGMRFAATTGERGALGRLGGDEFALVVPTGSEEILLALANELRSTLLEPFVLEGVTVHVGASMGVAVAVVEGSNAVEVIRSADVAMYESKINKSGVCVYRCSNDPNSREQLTLLSELRAAIDSQNLMVFFQPTLDMRTGLIRGAEALARWHHPRLGMVYPETFIPMTERAGLMPQLTRAVIVQTISEMSRLDRAGHPTHMSVNISRYDLLDSELPTFIKRVLHLHSVSPNRLTVEITESSLGTDPERAANCVRRLREQGIRISIDDYGVGYSSMSQLLELDIDEIKIDKSFVLGIDSDSRAEAIVRSAVELGRALGLQLVTEGIETEAALRALQAMGVDIGQGYFIAQPLASKDFQQFLVSSKEIDGVVAEFSLN